ncbi:hypothetical protein [Lentzea aerocolonigenes]|uniref:hypothetical protein n=1 Tax=Lentzea aerocolonigenes TaxID=68170 RepID=UPI000A9FD1B2|nr:hypothetical protein [Lentzea aerocolonigenes]MCP2245730.1 hypothetical protein [Lentzea aerocolonigenes]
MANTVPPDGVAAAAKELRELLMSRPEYRRKWMRYSQRTRPDRISYAGVSQVLALYLWEQGVKRETDVELPRQLRDTVRMALLGEKLTHRTLGWLIEAFDFQESDTHKVWSLFSGGSVTDFGGEGISKTLASPPIPLIKPQVLRTTTLFSRYYIDSELMLQRIENSHVVVALEDNVDTFAYSPRDTTHTVEGVAGGTFVGFHPSSPGFVGVELRLDRALRKGQQASLQYSTHHNKASQVCTDVRRAARKRMDNVDMRVIFERPPARAWWCVWDSYSSGRIVQKVEARLTEKHELHQFVPFIEETVVGFSWEWRR